MMGIVFVYDGRRIPARVVLEAVANHPLRVSTLDAQLDPETGPTDRKTVSVDFTLAPPIRIAGRVVNSETGRPVAGANLARNALFTTLAAPSSLTDREGRFELQILGPRRALWFWVYGEGFASTTVKTAVREQATSDWADTHDLVVRLRPMVPVTGVVQDENGKPPVEPLELQAVYEDRVDTVWKQSGRHLAADSQVAPDGSFNVKLPAGRITVGLCLPPQPMCSSVMFGMAPKNYRLQQVVNIPVAGMRDVLLKTSSPR